MSCKLSNNLPQRKHIYWLVEQNFGKNAFIYRELVEVDSIECKVFIVDRVESSSEDSCLDFVLFLR